MINKIWGTDALRRRIQKEKKKERECWFCQACQKKHYKKEDKFVICESCLRKLKELTKQ